jgi:hypothetical protein
MVQLPDYFLKVHQEEISVYWEVRSGNIGDAGTTRHPHSSSWISWGWFSHSFNLSF